MGELADQVPSEMVYEDSQLLTMIEKQVEFRAAADFDKVVDISNTLGEKLSFIKKVVRPSR